MNSQAARRSPTMDQKQIEKIAFRVIGDTSGAFTMALAYIGDRLGLFRAMAGAGPLTSTELARRLNLQERYVREWLKAMVTSEYINYDPETQMFFDDGGTSLRARQRRQPDVHRGPDADGRADRGPLRKTDGSFSARRRRHLSRAWPGCHGRHGEIVPHWLRQLPDHRMAASGAGIGG